MNLERTFAEWQTLRTANPARAHTLAAEASRNAVAADEESMRWLTASLSDEQRKFFTAAVFVGADAMPETLYEPMLRAAVYETSPLRVQAFIEPVSRAFGVKRVYQTLVDYVEKGSNYEKAGAVNALHWIAERKESGDSNRHKPVNIEILALHDYRRLLYLNTFISNPDLDLRRSIITYIDLDDFTATPPMKELIDKVVKIARQHPDEYIRHRVEVQLGRSPSAYSLPARKHIDTPESGKKSWWKQLWK